MPPVVHSPPIAMEDYIGGALAAGFISTFMSPSAAEFFFIKNKDGGLRRCIIMVRCTYPLPLVPPVFELLHEAHVFTKLDLRSTYLICIRKWDEWKTAFYTMGTQWFHMDWPMCLPSSKPLWASFLGI